MKKLLMNKPRIHKIILGAIIIIGLVPLFYFASIEITIAQAAAEDSMITKDTTKTADTTNTTDRFVDNVAFGVNEKFSYIINYGFINAGTATIEVPRLIEYNSRPCYQVVTRAKSNKFFSSFFKVDDRVESIIDAQGIYSWHFKKNLREGKYRAEQNYTFDQQNHLVYDGVDTMKVAPFVQDALSILYYIRTQKLEVGKSIFVDNFTDRKEYSLEVKVLKKETVKVPAGSFDCIVVEPLLQSVGMFRHQGKLTVWLTDDHLKMPVLMKTKVLIGSISAELTDYQLGDIEVF
ncbi:MAG: DUF3108 domain-containing protein [FCB group bacterium]|nr:DUF3108 domain-containing protein [FCB group bacterium]